MPEYARPRKQGFILYPWPGRRATKPDIGGVDPDFDALTDEELDALTVDERNAVGGRMVGTE